jgi:energy-coupling factor transporter ATP-binding protein EcfA2
MKIYMIEVIDLFYTYPGDKQAVLKDLNFENQTVNYGDFRSFRSWK